LWVRVSNSRRLAGEGFDGSPESQRKNLKADEGAGGELEAGEGDGGFDDAADGEAAGGATTSAGAGFDANFEVGAIGEGVEVEAEEDFAAVGAVVELLEADAATVHGALALIDVILAGAHPFRSSSRPGRRWGWMWVVVRWWCSRNSKAEDGAGEFGGGREFESAVDVGEVVAEELIELGAVGGFVFGAVPPAPVAAFGDEDLFVGEVALGGGDLVFVLVEGGAGEAEVLPGAVATSAPIQISKLALIQEPGSNT
jgi:hypothetical protein